MAFGSHGNSQEPNDPTTRTRNEKTVPDQVVRHSKFARSRSLADLAQSQLANGGSGPGFELFMEKDFDGSSKANYSTQQLVKAIYK